MRSSAVGSDVGRSIAIAATLIILVVAAAGTAVFREFHDGSVDAGSEWLRILIGGVLGLALGGVVVALLRRTGLLTRIVAGTGAAAIVLVLATVVAVGVTAGVATVHIGPRVPSAANTLPPTVATFPPSVSLDPIQSSSGGGLPSWVTTLIAIVAIAIVLLGLIQMSRAFKMPKLRIRGGLGGRSGTAGETSEEETDIDMAADSFDESAAMIGEGLDPRTAIIAAYARLLERLGEAGCQRLPYEAPEEHLRRSLVALGVPHAAMEKVVAKFLVARFSTHPLTDVDRDEVREALREAGRQLRVQAAAAAAEAAARLAESGAARAQR
ncbi:MAG: DUF4129 domain-containing protein [Ilumatobacteraceae bacterium]